jgi:hypothetical protein
MNELDYEPHLEHWKRQFGLGQSGVSISPANLKFVQERARHDHALAVWDPLLQLISTVSIDIPPKLSSRQAKIYMQHGAGRRIGVMFDAYRAIVSSAYENRTDPLHHEEQQSFSKDLNTLYMNLRGFLDSLAWCLMYERQPDLEKELRRTDFDLFSPKYRTKLRAFAEIEAAVIVHDEWNKDVKKRRDPVAHRIPLYLPPAILTPEEVARARELNTLQESKALAGQREEADRLFDQMNRIGKFFPFFMHHPDEQPIPIYPTIPNDVGHVIRLALAVEGALLSVT